MENGQHDEPVNLGLPYFHIFFIGFLRKNGKIQLKNTLANLRGNNEHPQWKFEVVFPGKSTRFKQCWIFQGFMTQEVYLSSPTIPPTNQHLFRLQTGPRQLHHGPNVILEAHPLLSLHCQDRFLHDQF